MTQVSNILQAAVRETNTIGVTQNLTPDQITEALERLQSLILSSLGGDVGYIMEDWNITDTTYTQPNGIPIPDADEAAFRVRPNSRLICNLAANLTLTLDPLPQDGARFAVVDAKADFNVHSLTLVGNGRKIEGSTANKVLNVASTSKQWIYRSDLADWVLIDPLLTTSPMPFPADFDDYFIILLAMRLNPRYGRTLDQQSKMRFDQQQLQFVNRYTQSRLRSIPSPAASNPARTPEG